MQWGTGDLRIDFSKPLSFLARYDQSKDFSEVV